MLRKKRFFQAKANMQKEKSVTMCRKILPYEFDKAPSSPEFIRLERPVHNTPESDMCCGRYMQLGVSNPPEVSYVS